MARVTLTFIDSPDGDGSFAIQSEPPAAALFERISKGGDGAASPAENAAAKSLVFILAHAKAVAERNSIIVAPPSRIIT